MKFSPLQMKINPDATEKKMKKQNNKNKTQAKSKTKTRKQIGQYVRIQFIQVQMKKKL